MIKEAIDRIISLNKPETIEIAGRIYKSSNYTPALESVPSILNIQSLIGLYDYVVKKVDAVNPETFIIHIKEYNHVELTTDCFGKFEQRRPCVSARCDNIDFNWGVYYDWEDFVIKLQTQFKKTPALTNLLKLVGGLQSKSSEELSDNGITQKTTVKSGISFVEEIEIDNPFNLEPFRTFAEIEPTKSPFIFRLKKGNKTPLCGLFPADDRVWKLDAIEKIKVFFVNAGFKGVILG